MASRAEAKWILANRNAWLEMADPDFLTLVAVQLVILHLVPVLSNMEAESCECLKTGSDIFKDCDTLSFHWLGNPVELNKEHGSIVLNVTNKELACKLEKGGLFYNYKYLHGGKYNKPSVTQCFRCLEVGHIAALCKAMKPTCVRLHGLKNCAVTCKTPFCVRCVKRDKNQNHDSDINTDNPSYAHSAYSAQCPLKSTTKSAMSKTVPCSMTDTHIIPESC
ncbi:hypothetical protein CROQUDRAFT_42461 [Cronartium quercuum f. sp. fusiforme G11]|uniref:CCHC-type domain-containing protein n=1 Tax=Cronartium quercuum f. sp. fusiforme G11 TaxID=708437 RepID=A0A9P6NIN5_9BASI|nr:hypothetical protein CROQUDRAFT_42461 [Cronartium quercuum f. sp. fusiforme G11]